MNDTLSYQNLISLRKVNIAWRLLSAKNAPFIASFLFRTFITPNKRSLNYDDLLSQLDDYIYYLQENFSHQAPHRTAGEYIEEWSSGESAYLGQRYIRGSEIPEVDLTPSTEKAIRWLESLETRSFVGTESRLLTIFQLLQDLVHHTDQNQEAVLARLQEKKASIEREIEKVKAGKIDRHDATQIRERYLQIEDNAKGLLADFRQVEENFRLLDRQIREKIAFSDDPKGELLDQVFGEHDAINNTDQGHSFSAFWEFLLQTGRQEEFRQFLQHIFALEEVAEFKTKGLLPKFTDYLMEAGNKIYLVNNQLTGQLRKFLDDKIYMENKRVMALVRSIEKKGLGFSKSNFNKKIMTLDQLKPSLNLALTFSRQLFTTTDKVKRLSSFPEEIGSDQKQHIPTDALYDQDYVDETILIRRINQLLLPQGQVTLKEILKKFPLEKGLAELVAYLKIASARQGTVFSKDSEDIYIYHPEEGHSRQVCCPEVIFVRFE